MEYLTIREQEILAGLKNIDQNKIDFNTITKTDIARQLNMQVTNFYRTLKNLAKKGHINYKDNSITYN
jgi:DNA-binding MarR family transcriptional regulator